MRPQNHNRKWVEDGEAVIKIQPFPLTDDPREPEPYPYFCDSAGKVLRQDFWCGKPSHCIGFSPKTHNEVTVLYEDAFADPSVLEGKNLYPVFADADGKWWTMAGEYNLTKEEGAK